MKIIATLLTIFLFSPPTFGGNGKSYRTEGPVSIFPMENSTSCGEAQVKDLSKLTSSIKKVSVSNNQIKLNGKKTEWLHVDYGEGYVFNARCDKKDNIETCFVAAVMTLPDDTVHLVLIKGRTTEPSCEDGAMVKLK